MQTPCSSDSYRFRHILTRGVHQDFTAVSIMNEQDTQEAHVISRTGFLLPILGVSPVLPSSFVGYPG